MSTAATQLGRPLESFDIMIDEGVVEEKTLNNVFGYAVNFSDYITKLEECIRQHHEGISTIVCITLIAILQHIRCKYSFYILRNRINQMAKVHHSP